MNIKHLDLSRVLVFKAIFGVIATIAALTPVKGVESRDFQTISATSPKVDKLFISQVTPTFSDVPSSFWASQYIQRLAAQEIITGYPNGKFRPNNPITRAEFAALLSKAFSQSQVRDFQGFSDILKLYWGFDAIREANTTGFMSGYPDGRFRPDDNIRRGEVLVSIVSGLNYTPQNVTAETVNIYQDADEISAWMLEKIAASTERQIVVNYPDVQELNLDQEATRAEVAAMIYQALANVGEVPQISSDYVPNSTQSTDPTPINPDLTPSTDLPSIITLKKISHSKRRPYFLDDIPENQELLNIVAQDIYSTSNDEIFAERTPVSNDTATAIANDPILKWAASDNENALAMSIALKIPNFKANKISAISYLSDTDWQNFDQALNNLIQAETEQSLIALKELLKENDLLLQEAAIYGLGKKGAASKIAIPDLMEILQTSESAMVRINTVNALSRIALTQTNVTSSIISSLLEDESALVQSAAIEALGKINLPSSSVISALVETYIDDSKTDVVRDVRDEAAKALKKISLENISLRSVELLIQNFVFEFEVCSNTTKILSNPNALPMLSNILREGDPDIRLRIIQVLAISSSEEIESPPSSLLFEALENYSIKVRLAAIAVLLARGVEANKVIPVLSPMLQSDREDIRMEAERLMAIAQKTDGGVIEVPFDDLSSIKSRFVTLSMECSNNKTGELKGIRFGALLRKRWPW